LESVKTKGAANQRRFNNYGILIRMESIKWYFFQTAPLIPDYAVAEFAEDARRRVRRRTLVLQVPDNKANSVKSATPCGFKCRKNISKISFTFWVKDLNTFVKYNRPILKIKFPFSVFEVHNSG
jgi:hypothetical protein